MIGRNFMLIISGSWKVNRKHLTYMYIDEETTEEWFYVSGSWKVNRKHLTYMYIDEETTEEWFYVLHVVCMCLKVHTHVHILFKC